MAENNVKNPKSPKYSLSWAVEKAIHLLEEEGTHPVPPDIMAAHLGYSNARNGQAATVLANLRMYGLLVKAPNQKEMVSGDVKKYKYTPYGNEKHSITEHWLKKPRLFSLILSKHSSNLPSDAALKYELIQEYGFTADAASKLIKTLKDSISFVNSLAPDDSVIDESEDDGNNDIESELQSLNVEEAPVSTTFQQDISPRTTSAPTDGCFSVSITGPGIHSVIEIKEEEDLMIVEAMLKKVSKKIFTEK